MGVRRKRFRSAKMHGRKNQMRRYKGLDIKRDVVVVLKKTGEITPLELYCLTSDNDGNRALPL